MNQPNRGIAPLIRQGVLAVSIYVLTFPVVRAQYSGTCPNGAPARSESYCSFFKRFNTNTNETIKTVIADNLGITSANETRSIALIIAIDKYPYIPNGDVSAAAVDGDNLADLFIKNQGFDEVIVLRNDEASVENINYFLQDYLINRADEFNKKARLVIAYSGHGTSDTPTTEASFLLSSAEKLTDSVHSYKMKNFSGDVQKLADHYFHVLTLINACYGGSFFKTGAEPGGSPSAPEFPGSYAITAGSQNDESRSLDIKRGSLFFDLLIGGITKGIADDSYWNTRLVDETGNLSTVDEGLVRTGPLHLFIDNSYVMINEKYKRISGYQKLSHPWLGPAQKGHAEGAFFFVSKKGKEKFHACAEPYLKMASNDTPKVTTTFGLKMPMDNSTTTSRLEAMETQVNSALLETISKPVAMLPIPADIKRPEPIENRVTPLPPGPISSLPGRPDIKIFKAPNIYPVKGYDLSSGNGDINWKILGAAKRPRFIYQRAVSWKGADIKFNDNWSHTKTLGIDQGAYLTFDFCLKPTEQMKRLSKAVPLDTDALPLAIVIQDPKGQNDLRKSQHKCLNAKGINDTRDAILELASKIHKRYGKIPILHGNRYSLNKFLDQRSEKFMIWVDAYKDLDIQMPGRNPWTLWQYSVKLKINGVDSDASGDAFFGTEDQYKLFKKGGSNIALDAVRKD